MRDERMFIAFKVVKVFKESLFNRIFHRYEELAKHLCCAANFMFAASLRSLKSLMSLRTLKYYSLTGYFIGAKNSSRVIL